jgi:hypothetical protein
VEPSCIRFTSLTEIAARDRVPSHVGGSMWFMLAIG